MGKPSLWYLLLVAIFLSAALFQPASANAQTASQNPFCLKLSGGQIQASDGAHMFCFGAQASGNAPISHKALSGVTSLFANVDAGNFAEDVSPSGVQSFGQAETSVAAVGPYVVEAWNDATGFFSPCPSANFKEELTGLGFSSNSGASFSDLGGIPNSNCANLISGGDPSVEAWTKQGFKYFYISSLYNSPNYDGPSNIALTACRIEGSGSTALLSCNQPVIAATSSECQTFSGFTFCSFLDKDFLAIDPARGRLYVTYSDFRLLESNSVDL